MLRKMVEEHNIIRGTKKDFHNGDTHQRVSHNLDGSVTLWQLRQEPAGWQVDHALATQKKRLKMLNGYKLI